MNRIFETVLELRKLDPATYGVVVDLFQLFLCGNNNPGRREELLLPHAFHADLAELLYNSPQILQFIAAAGHILPHFVHNKNKRLAGTPAGA